MLYRPHELRRLADAYLAATGANHHALSEEICGRSNNRLIGRLLEGYGASSASLELATDFFNRQWPQGVAWPKGIARNGVTKEAAE